MNYNHFHYYTGLWGGAWSAILSKAKIDTEEKSQLFKVVNALAETVSHALNSYTDTSYLTVEDVAKLPYPTLFTRVPLIDGFLLLTIMGDDRYIKSVKEVYGEDYEKEHYSVFVENVAHLDRILNDLLPKDDALKDLIKLINEACSTDSVKGRIVTSSLVAALLEWFAWELQVQQLGKRIINDGGYYEFVAYDDPRQLDITGWKLTNGKQ